MPFTKIEEVLGYMHDLLDANKGELGIEYVGYGDEQLVPRYPAILVIPGNVARTLHATRTFENRWNIEIYVYHANLTKSRSIRNKEDYELVTRVRDILHQNMGMVVEGQRQIVHGWVDSEAPGILASAKGDAVIGTRITWTGIGHERFQFP